MRINVPSRLRQSVQTTFCICKVYAKFLKWTYIKGKIIPSFVIKSTSWCTYCLISGLWTGTHLFSKWYPTTQSIAETVTLICCCNVLQETSPDICTWIPPVISLPYTALKKKNYVTSLSTTTSFSLVKEFILDIGVHHLLNFGCIFPIWSSPARNSYGGNLPGYLVHA